jgi:hypothetical protein
VPIADCFIRHFNGNGIDLRRVGTARFLISNTVSSDNGGAGLCLSFALFPFNGVVDRFTASGDNIGMDLEARESGISVTNRG